MSSSTPTPTSAIELTEQWHWEGWTTADEEAHGGAVDSDGNLLLVGIQNNEVITYNDDLYASGGSEDFAAVKIEGASGEVLWTYVGSSTGYETDILLDCDTDSNNDVYVAGYTQGFWTMSNAPNSRHLMCAKLDGSTGTDIWRYQTTAPSSTTEDYIYYGSGMVSGVAVNGEDDVFLVGYTYNSLVYGEGTTDNRDYVAIKLDGETGERIFTVQGGSDFEHDELRAAKCDASGDLVAVGMRGDDNEDGEYHVIKLSGVDGSVMWEYAALSTSTIDLLNDIDFDHDGNVLVGGGKGAETMHGRTAETPVVLKLSGATGAVMWTYEGDAELGTIFRAVAVHPDTAWVVAAGVTEGSWLNGAANAGETDFAAVVLDGATGEELLRYQDGTDGDEAVMTAEFDSAGGLFLGGWTNGTWSADDNGSGGDGLNVAAVKLVLSQDNVIVSGTGSASDSALLSTGEVMAIGFSGAALILVAALCEYDGNVLFRTCRVTKASTRVMHTKPFTMELFPAARSSCLWSGKTMYAILCSV